MASLFVREGTACLVAFRDGRCDNDDATFDSFPLLYMSWEKPMQARAVCRSRGRSYLVEVRDGCCDNADGLVVAHLLDVLGNMCWGGAFWQS